MIKLLIVDDAPLILEGLTVRLEKAENIEVVAVAENTSRLKQLVEVNGINLILLDLLLPEKHKEDEKIPCFTSIREISQRFPDIGILIMSALEDRLAIREVFRCGASGFISKVNPVTEFVKAIQTVYEGRIYGPLELLKAIKPFDLLSEIEKETMAMRGGLLWNVKTIASKQNIAISTVHSRLERIKSKMQFASTEEILAYVQNHIFVFQDLISKYRE